MAHVSVTFNPVSIGHGFSFFLSEDAVWCCGNDDCGALGLGKDIKKTFGKLYRVTPLSNITFVSCGQGHTLFLDNEGTAWGCGWNAYGQLGMGAVDLNYPVLIPGVPKFQVMHTSYNHSIFLDFEGTPWVCGWNDDGQLGLRDVSRQFLVQRISNLPKIQGICAGNRESTFVDVEGGVWITKRNQPIFKIEDLPAIKFASNNERHALFLDYSGSVWGRGENGCGELGLGDCISRASSEKVLSSEVFTAISTGERHSLFLAENGQVYGCGSNKNYQLGLTSLACTANLMLIPDLPPIAIICAGTQQSVFVDVDGGCWACGANNEKQLTNIGTKIPTKIELPPLKFRAKTHSKSARNVF